MRRLHWFARVMAMPLFLLGWVILGVLILDKHFSWELPDARMALMVAFWAAALLLQGVADIIVNCQARSNEQEGV